MLDAGIQVRERTALRGLRPAGRDGIVALISTDRGKGIEESESGPVVLATGGAGSLYRQSSNPSIEIGRAHV